MSEVRDLGQRHIAALWDAARTLTGDAAVMAERMTDLLADMAEVEAQLAGLRLHLLHEARLSALDAVVEGVRQSVRTTSGQATAALKLSADLADRFPLIAAALNDGAVSLAQAGAIVAGLKKLPPRLTRGQLVECQETILSYVDILGPSELRKLATRLVEVVDPDMAEADDAKRLAAEERAAHRGRFLRLAPDYHGSMRITGQLPVADAALLAAQLDALMPPQTVYQEAGEVAGPEVRRADALVLLTQIAANSRQLPAHGGDRPSLDVSCQVCSGLVGAGGVDAGLIVAGGCDETPRDVCGAGFQAEGFQVQGDVWRPGGQVAGAGRPRSRLMPSMISSAQRDWSVRCSTTRRARRASVAGMV